MHHVEAGQTLPGSDVGIALGQQAEHSPVVLPLVHPARYADHHRQAVAVGGDSLLVLLLLLVVAANSHWTVAGLKFKLLQPAGAPHHFVPSQPRTRTPKHRPQHYTHNTIAITVIISSTYYILYSIIPVTVATEAAAAPPAPNTTTAAAASAGAANPPVTAQIAPAPRETAPIFM